MERRDASGCITKASPKGYAAIPALKDGACAAEVVVRTTTNCAVDLWIHGHIHSSMDYCVGRGRVLANPCGYGWSADVLKRQLENKDFEPMLVIEV